jgi:hypothetical protein
LVEQPPPTSPPPRPPSPGGGQPPPSRGPSRPSPSGGGGPRIGNLPISAVIVIVIAVAVLVWLLFIRGDDDNSNSSNGGGQATKTVTVVSESALPGEVADVGYPVYWLGPRPGVDYEVTVITDGRTYVRYLPKGEAKESPNPYLTVGSYSQNNAFDVLTRLGKRQGEGTVSIPNGGIALKNTASGAYVAFPGADTQIEVYDPQPGQAFKIVKSGDLSQIG